jgi:hypothetical protein
MQTGNYIHQLQMEVRNQHETIEQIREAYQDLLIYLVSPKFHNDTTVQVQDVLNRLQPIRSALMVQGTPLSRKLTQPVIATGEITSL